MARGFKRPVQGSKRLTTWVGPADQGFVSVTSSNRVLIGSFEPNSAGNNMIRPTVVRTRGSVAIAPIVNIAADVDVTGAYGLAVVSVDAFNVGVGSIPQPFDDADWPGWFVWRSFAFRWEHNASPTGRFSSITQEVDSKAMRKVGANEIVVLIAESQSGAFDISMPLRMLMKLS